MATKTPTADTLKPEELEEVDKKDIRSTPGKEFFESRNNMQLSKSAFDRIGNLGVVESRA